MRCRGGSRIFFRRGCTRLLLYFNTNKPHSFCRIPVVLENRRSSRGGVHTPCTLPLDPPLRCQGSNPLSIIIWKLHVTFLCKLFLRIWCYIKTLSFHDHIANFLNFHYCLLENVSKCIVTKSILLTPITSSI